MLAPSLMIVPGDGIVWRTLYPWALIESSRTRTLPG